VSARQTLCGEDAAGRLSAGLEDGMFFGKARRGIGTWVSGSVWMGVLWALAVQAGAQDRPVPKFEVYGGYSYLYPNAVATGTLRGGLVPLSSCLCDIRRGAGATLTYDFTRVLGLTADVSGHWSPSGATEAERISRSSFYNASIGPKFTLRTRHFSPFAEGLVGAHRLTPELFSPDVRVGIMAGGGLDWNVGKHVAIRIARADFVFSSHRFGINSADPETNVKGVRLQSGVVWSFGTHAPGPLPAPAPVPVPVPALVAALAAPAAPSVVCSASPAEMKSGESSTITAVGTSAPGHALRYSYGSSAGSVNGSSTTALLSTAGVAAGTIVVTCNVADDLGQTASAETTVELEAAPLAAVAATSPLCGVSFARDTRRPARVDNEAKACLDDIALNLQRSPDAQLALVGDAAAGEPRRERLAAQRAVDTKAYLVSEKGIDAARILVFSGSGGEKTVSATLVPAGATFDSAQDRPVDEGVVKANTRRTGGGPQRRR
jgi:hypothetical protein